MGGHEEIRNGISRRTALKRIGAAGAIAWATPVITSMRTPAFAVSPAGGGTTEIYGGDQTYYSGMCAVGGNPGPTVGSVTISADASNVYVTATVSGLIPTTDYDIWVNQDPGGCPLGGPNGGVLHTNLSGAGSASATIPRVGGATVAWISLTFAAFTVYRSGTVPI
jgi:hypothetical protein